MRQIASYCNTQLIFEIDQNSFPIIGKSTPEVVDRLKEERRVSAFDLWDVRQPVVLTNYLSFDDEPNVSSEIEKIVVRREGGNIYFNAVAEMGLRNNNGEWVEHPEHSTLIIAQSKISVSKILSAVKLYTDHHLQDEALHAEFYKAGNIEKMKSADYARNYMHNAIAEIIISEFDNQQVQLPSLVSTEVKRGRYLSTAMMMHVVPAKVFESIIFLERHMKAKYKENDEGVIRPVKPIYNAEKNPFSQKPT